MDQWSASAGVYICPRQRWRWWRLSVWDVFNVFNVGKYVQFFDSIFVNVEFTTLSRFNASWRAANSQMLLACNLKVLRMV
jgi:hypothetical protein